MNKHLLLISIIGISLIGCGFKGPLYMPKKSTAASSPTKVIKKAASKPLASKPTASIAK